MPSGVKGVPYAPVKSIDFIGKKVLTAIETLQFPRASTSSTSSFLTYRSLQSKSPTSAFEMPTQEQTEAFFASLSTCKTKPAVLSLLEPYASNYIPKSVDENLPICLSGLYNCENLRKNYVELLRISEMCV